MKTVIIVLAAIISICLSAKLPPKEQLLVPQEQEEIPERPKPYNFGFEVRDDNTTNYQNRAEVSDEFGRVKGSYSYVLPDGFVYTVTYEDRKDGSGLVATVRKEPSGINVIIPQPSPEKKKHHRVL